MTTATTVVRCYTNSFLPIEQLKSLPIDAFDVSLWKEEHPPHSLLYHQQILLRDRIKLVWFLNLGTKYVVDISKIQWIASVAQILEIHSCCYGKGGGEVKKFVNQITVNNPHIKQYMHDLINSIPIKRKIIMTTIEHKKLYPDVYFFSSVPRLPRQRRIFKICRIVGRQTEYNLNRT